MTDGERIDALQQKTGLSWKDLASKVGIASAQTFTDIRNGRHGISAKLANKITEAFPDIRKEWLLFESGTMTHSEMAGMISLYDSAKDMNMERKSPDKINVGSLFPKAEIAIRNASDSMVEYPLGCVLVLKRVNDESLLMPGSDYLVETDEFAVVRRVQKGKDDAHIALYSSNTSTYPDGKMVYEPFEIPMDSVKRIFSILGYIYAQATDINKV